MTKTEYPRIGETVLTETLPNGLRVAIVPKPGYRKRYAFFTTRYGGMDMKFKLDGVWHDTPAGIAHYLEHKMFDTEDGNALLELSMNGAEPNAFTANSMTAYYFDCTEHFEDNLRRLLSFVTVPWFTEESVEKERGIIAQEIRMTEDSPSWRLYKDLLGCLYRNSPVSTAIAGTVESIQLITPQLLYDCHKAFYAPSNMALCVVGSVDAEKVVSIAREVVTAEAGEEIERDYGSSEDSVPARPESRRTMEVASRQFLAGFKCDVPAAGEALLRDSLIGDLACDVLISSSSPLYNRLYAAGDINDTFDCEYSQLPGVAYVSLGGECREPERVTKLITDEAARLGREGVDEALFRQLLRASFGSSLRALNSFENIAAALTDGCFRGFDPNRFPEVYDAITKEDVENYLRVNFVPERQAIAVLEPIERD